MDTTFFGPAYRLSVLLEHPENAVTDQTGDYVHSN